MSSPRGTESRYVGMVGRVLRLHCSFLTRHGSESHESNYISILGKIKSIVAIITEREKTNSLISTYGLKGV